MRACGAPQRGSGRQGRGARGRWLGQPAGDRDADGLRDAAQVEQSTGTSTASRSPGLGGRRLYMPRGKVVGGSGSINAMIYIRGNRADYDGWAAGGAEGWSYDEVLPYFKRSEDNERGEDEFHGVGGPMSVSDSRAMSPLIETMIEASRLAGHERQPGLQRRSPGGRRALPAHAAQRAPLLDRRRVPAPGDGAAEPGRPHRRDGAAHPLRRLARRRRRGRPRTARSRRSEPSVR